MNSKIRKNNRKSATGYLTKAGSNRNDAKTQAAYERFKTPPWYLQNKKGNNEHDTQCTRDSISSWRQFGSIDICMWFIKEKENENELEK